MQYFVIKVMVYVETELKNNDVFLLDVTVAVEQLKNQVTLEFILWEI